MRNAEKAGIGAFIAFWLFFVLLDVALLVVFIWAIIKVVNAYT